MNRRGFLKTLTTAFAVPLIGKAAVLATQLEIPTYTNFKYDSTGKLLFAYQWNRALSAEEIKSLHADPYQFLNN